MWRHAALTAFLAVTTASPALAEDPRPISRVNPEYPFAALNRGVRGSVLVEYKIDQRGRVVAPRVLEAKPPGVFDGAALRALSRWRYEPANDEAQVMKVRMTFQP